MANAIYKTEAGNTVAGVAGHYYAVRRPDGIIRGIELGKVTRAIRRATGPALTGFSDAAALPAGLTLAVPTMRELNRAVFADNPALDTALAAHGFDHARKLLRYSPRKVAGALRPLPEGTTEAQVSRAWMLTALLNLDGMDHYTARFLYDQAGIRSLKELAAQSVATIDTILHELTGPEHGRPAELITQDHSRRWIVSAKIQVRKRIGELTKIRDRFFQIPFAFERRNPASRILRRRGVERGAHYRRDSDGGAPLKPSSFPGRVDSRQRWTAERQLVRSNHWVSGCAPALAPAGGRHRHCRRR